MHKSDKNNVFIFKKGKNGFLYPVEMIKLDEGLIAEINFDLDKRDKLKESIVENYKQNLIIKSEKEFDKKYKILISLI